MKILYLTTVSSTINSFLVPHIKLLLRHGHQVDVACNLTRPIASDLLDSGCNVFNIGFQRKPIKFENYIAYKDLKTLIQKNNYDLVHTHTPNASAIVRMICRKKRNVKVIYTAHGFHFYKGAPLKNWVLYFPVERWLSRFTDVLITINKEDYETAKKSLKAGRVEYLAGVGIDAQKFKPGVVNKIEKRKEINVPNDSIMLLSVGELNKNKNHETVIKAIARLKNPNLYYLICGRGCLSRYLNNLIISLGVSENVRLLGFRTDVIEIYQAADIFVHPSYREGLPVAVMEAMASGLPIICSKIRGNIDLVENGEGGYLVDPNNIEGFSEAIRLLINKQKMQTMGQINVEKIKPFDFSIIKDKIIKIYEGEFL